MAASSRASLRRSASSARNAPWARVSSACASGCAATSPWVSRLLRASPPVVRKTPRKASMRPAGPARSTAAMRSDALTSLAEPDARTPAAAAAPHRTATPASFSSRSASANIGAEPDGLAVDLLRLGEGVIAVVVEAHGRGQPLLLAQRPGEQLVEIAVGGIGHGRLERAGERRARRRGRLGQHLVGGLGQQLAPLVLVEDGEARRHAGLQRKALQQPLAEGVDGLHLEAAGRLDGDGKELPRPLHLGRRRRPVEQLGELGLAARRRASSPTRQAARTRASTSPPPRPWCRSAPGCARAACRRAAGAARAWSARASCRCRRWR